MRQNSGVRVLVIEDHVGLANDIAAGLRNQGIAVDTANNGDDGMFKATIYPYDVIVLDRDLPGRHGDDICIDLSKGLTESRILMVTASAAVEDRVEGLNLGADDYLHKPFAFEELVARIQSLARRRPSVPPVMVWGDLECDRAHLKVHRNGSPISLNKKEFGVLEILLMANGAVVTTKELLDRVWDEFADPFTRVVTVTISRLRQKLGKPDLIETLIGSGYRLK
jgi:DNA-binding response OmpR family regulator